MIQPLRDITKMIIHIPRYQKINTFQPLGNKAETKYWNVLLMNKKYKNIQFMKIRKIVVVMNMFCKQE